MSREIYFTYAAFMLLTPTLHTARLLLRPFTEADTDAIFALLSNPRVLRYWDAPPWKTRAQAARFIARCKQSEEDGSRVPLAMMRNLDNAFIGWCSLQNVDAVYRSALLGYCLDEPAWGQGFATEAASALLDWAFSNMNLIRIQSEADTRNAASDRVLQKLGFMREGTLRENCIVDGEVSDSWIYGLLKREWKPLE